MGLLASEGGGVSNYLVYKHNDKNFWLSKDQIVEFTHIILDTETIKTGWGIYIDGNYDYVWDDRPGVRTPRPAEIKGEKWKPCFSVWCWLEGWDQPVIWQSFTAGNAKAFDIAVDCYMPTETTDEAKNKLPCLKSIKDEKGFLLAEYLDDRKLWSWPTFEFAKWVDRPEGFILPEWASDDYPGVDPVEKKEITNDDIPF